MKEKLYEDLLDPSCAAAYVNEALLEGDEVVFKTAVADVIRAHGVGKVAKAAGVNRVTVQDAETGNTHIIYNVSFLVDGLRHRLCDASH
jgi:DNA-binding phage protein